MSAQAFQWFVILSLTVCTFIYADSGQSIPFNQLGAEAAKRSGNKEISVTELWNGYRLECRMQDLQAEVTMSGAILRSTSESEGAGAFSIRAARIGREKAMKEIPLKIDLVNASDDVVRAQRGNVVEEYTTSGDGIRQDFVITHRPGGRGNLVLELAVEGADPVVTGDAIKVTLASGRELAYHALNVIDAKGKVLAAQFKTAGGQGVKIAVDDRGAKYPIRIDPTISDADWVSMGGMPGVGGHVYALMFDGKGDLYAGGSFILAGGVVVNNIAKWNGRSWSSLGCGTNDGISDIALDDSGNLYIAGYFDTAGGIAANHVARWNGNAWSALGSGVSGDDFLHSIKALALDGSGNLYVGGRFDTAGGIAIKNIAKWNGNTWSALGSGVNGEGPLEDVRSLASDGSGNIYVGGGFDTEGEIAVNHIAKWDGNAWSALGSGTDSMVLAVAVDGFGNLFAGGWLTKAGGIDAHHVAKWDGDTWSALGSGVDYVENFGMEKFCIEIDDSGNIYVGGHLTTGGLTTNHLVKWNGEAWSSPGNGINEVFCLETDGSGSVYVGGYSRISKWVGGAWSTFGSYGTNSYILALAGDSSGKMYAGGSFTAIGNDGIAVKGIAKWDGSQWSALDSGANAGSYPYVRALVSDGSGNLYASGYISDHPVARWDGTAWSALGSDMIGDIYCLAADDSGNLYAGGRFATVSGITVNNIAKWDGSVWHALGSGIDDSASYPYVYALTIGGSGNLYAAGSFDTAGGVPARNIAKWDGKAWSSLGSGVKAKGDIPVLALASDKAGNLYAGGYFDTAGGIAANNIAKWDGSKWSALGSGIDHPVDLDGQTGVFALSFDNDGNLYAGGGFDTAGGIPAHFIARWDGSQWSALGSGVSGGNVAGMYQSCIFALAIDNADNLYAGGEFLSAGGKVSPNVAMCRLNGSAVQPRRTVNSSLHPLAYDSRSSIIRLNVQSATNVSYRIFSLAGREVHRDAAFMPKGNNSLRINTASLAHGPYIAQVNAGKESMRFRVTVKR